MSALLPSRLVPEDMLSEWQGPNLPNTKNYAPSEDSIGGMIRNALLSGVAGVGGFTGLPMSDEGNRAALLGELLAAGMPLVGGVKALRGVAGAKKLPYKAARESLRDVADANFDYGIPVGNRTVNIDTLRGGMSAAADDAAKVNKIAQQMSSKDGYIERLIVDQNGNVIEGQHRLRALQSLGVQDVPVSVIQDYSDVVETLQKQGMRPEHARQVTQQTHDMLKESGSAAKVRSDYNLSGQYEAQFESALDLMDAPKAKQGIKAFHGSPHDFDQFSLSKIGTGEGNQSYLRGLYFAENENVATDYRNALAPQFEVGGKPVVSAAQIRNDPKAINRVQDLWGYINSLKMDDLGSAKLYAARLDAMESTSDEMRQLMDSWQHVKAAPTGQINKGRGHMYEVNIDADPEDFLDWDAPLSQQSEKVRQKLPTYLQPQEGENMGDALRRIRMDEDPEEGLRAAGIQGIKYLDEGSRGPSFRVGLLKDRIAREKAQGLPFDHWQQELDALEKTQSTRNYVVFDDTKISIVKKYGIAGALSAGAINELEARQLQAQGYQ
jgi:hypothetical protein